MSLCASSLFCSFVFQHPDRSGQVTPRTKFAFERFFSELVTVVASICLYQHNRNRAQSERTWTTGAMSTWCLTFTALQRMTSAAYQLLLNMRIIAVAVLSVVSWERASTRASGVPWPCSQSVRCSIGGCPSNHTGDTCNARHQCDKPAPATSTHTKVLENESQKPYHWSIDPGGLVAYIAGSRGVLI